MKTHLAPKPPQVVNNGLAPYMAVIPISQMLEENTGSVKYFSYTRSKLQSGLGDFDNVGCCGFGNSYSVFSWSRLFALI